MPVNAATKLNKKKLTLNVGQSYTLKAKGISDSITWSSSNKKTATVSTTGIVTANKKGSCKITAKYKKRKLTCKVTVKQPVTNVSLNKTSVTLKKGKKITLKVKVNPGNANNKSLTWKSNNKKVATVSKKGAVKAVGKGIAKITVSTKDGSKKFAECMIYVGVTPTPNPTPTPTPGQNPPTVSDPYLITTAEQLFAIEGKTGNYHLGCDINVTSYQKTISTFDGQLDGEGHKIINLRQPLLNRNNGTIKNITFDNCNISGKNSKICAIAIYNNGTILNCTVKGTLSLTEGGNIAGIAVSNRKIISNCSNYASIIADDKSVDILGNELHTGTDAAGICSINAGRIDKSTNYATIDNNGSYTGGIVSDNTHKINHCINYGSITSKGNAGGIAASNSKKISNCLNAGPIKSTRKHNGIVGYQTGYSNGILQYCINIGKSNYGITEQCSSHKGVTGPYILDCYYLASASEAGAQETEYTRFFAISNNNLSNIASFSALNFSNDWIMGNAYPIPRQ